MSTYTPSLGLELITPGSQAGLWGNTTNNSLTLIDQAITGVTPISFASASGSTYTLTNFNGAEDEARAAVLNITGSASGSNTVVIPNKQKTYLVRNNTGQDVVFRTASPTATYSVGAGYSILIFCDGNNNVFTGIASPGVGTLSVNAGGTGATTFTAGFVKSTGGTNALTSASAVALGSEVSGTLPVGNGGTGVTSFTSGGVLIGNGTGNLATVTASTTGYVLTWNGSQWVAAASASGGVTSISGLAPVVVTGTTTPTISLSTVPVSNGGTGQTSFTSGGAIYASGTSTLTSGTLPVTAGGTGGTTLDGAGIVTKSGTQTISGAKTFSTAFTVDNYGTAFNGGTGGSLVNLAVYMYGQREGQLGLYYAANGSQGWHIGQTTSAGGAFVVYPNDNSIGGAFIDYTSTTWSGRSDRRIKKDLVVIPNALDKLDKINGYTGKFIDDEDNKSRSFLVAQEFQDVLPEAVCNAPRRDTDGDGVPEDLLGLSYTDVIPLLVQAIKELKAEVATLKAAK